jgi:DNA replication protein
MSDGGFPNSAAGTVIPNAFFSSHLPEMTDPAELAVSAYVFFALGQKRRHPRFVTERELESDATLLRTLASLSLGDDALERGLRLAVERGTLVRAASGEEALFAVNMPVNRRALERLAAEGVRVETPLPPRDGSVEPNIFSLYEENIGAITPLLAEDLREAEATYPPAWIEDAVREAVELNKRSWRYVRSILRRWETEGRDEEHRRDPEADWLARRYREGKRPHARSSS